MQWCLLILSRLSCPSGWPQAMIHFLKTSCRDKGFGNASLGLGGAHSNNSITQAKRKTKTVRKKCSNQVLFCLRQGQVCQTWEMYITCIDEHVGVHHYSVQWLAEGPAGGTSSQKKVKADDSVVWAGPSLRYTVHVALGCSTNQVINKPVLFSLFFGGGGGVFRYWNTDSS